MYDEPPAKTPPPRRRSQDERSAATQERLLQATFESLVELGYARTSTPEVLRRSGVSRGALLHHFPTKADLVTAAVDYVFERQLQEYAKTFSAVEDPVDRPGEAVELLWSMVSGETFYAWLELVVASRTDPVLREKIKEVQGRFDRGAVSIREDFFPPPEQDIDLYKVVVPFGFATLTGLAVSRIYEADRRQRKVIEALKQLASLLDHHLSPSSDGEVP